MKEQFQLLHYGKLSLAEQNIMTAENRSKWLKMTEQDLKDRAEAERKAQSKTPSRGRRK